MLFFFIQNIDCGYSLEPPWPGDSINICVPTINVLSKYNKDINFFLMKFFYFYR